MALILVCGKDYPSVFSKAQQNFLALCRDVDESNREIIDADVASSDETIAFLNTTIQSLLSIPLFPGPRVIWLKNAKFLGDSPAAKSEKTQAKVDELISVLSSNPAPDTSFILSTTELNRARSPYKKFAKIPGLEIITCDPLDSSSRSWESDISTLARESAAQRGLKFAPHALKSFIYRISESPAAIPQELDKIDLFLGPAQREIDEATVAALIAPNRASSIFEVGNAIRDGNFSRAISIVEYQLARKENPLSILNASILPSVRDLLLTRVFSSLAGSSPAQWPKKLPPEFAALLPLKKDGSPMTWKFEKLIPLTSRISDAAILLALRSCYSTSKAMVTTQTDPTVLLQKLLAELKSLLSR